MCTPTEQTDPAENPLELQSSLSDSRYSGDSQASREEPVVFLAELVGACGLRPDDANEELRPYCIVKLGDRIIHQSNASTDSGPNPIWTIGTKSLFLLKVTSDDFSNNKKLTISLWSKRRDALTFTTEASFLGKIQLDVEDVLSHCDEERFEVNINDWYHMGGDHHGGEGRHTRGTVALRFRVATDADRAFVSAHNRNDKRIGQVLNNEEEEMASRRLAVNVTEADETEVAGVSFVNAIAAAFTYKSYTERNTGVHKIRVKPNPDPERREATEFMTHNEIKTETPKPSKKWVEAGSGTLGTLFLEILSCSDLPNVDVGEAVGNVTDAFVCAVYEDAMVQTDTIDDELSPHWLPWTQRAFRFGIMHPASMLYLAVFDYDIGITNHEAIGRVGVNVSNFQRDTTYTLTYNLHKSSNVTDRTAHGTLTIRLRIEMHDEKAALMAALKPRPRIHVNVKKEKTFHVVRYTCFGEYDNEEKFDLTVLRSYINEIFEYKSSLSYVFADSLYSLMFWRGQVQIFSVLWPVHSFLFFCAGTTLVEHPYMMPSFLLLGVAWIMLASMSRQRHHPSPWMRCQSFHHYLEILWTGKSSLSVKRIGIFDGWEETKAYDKAWEDRIAKDQKRRDDEYARIQEINKVGNDKIETKVDGFIPLELMVRLARYQGIVGKICRQLRLVKIIMTWEESIVSFWITAVFLASGLVSLLLPWRFILTWMGRIIMWGLFGPHMKLVDLFLQERYRNDDNAVEKALVKFREMSNEARLRREEAVKLKDVKDVRFGKYITEIPAFNLTRHYDRPLPQSFARLYRPKGSSELSNKHQALWLPPQQLLGAMIPRAETVYERNRRLNLDQINRLTRLEARIAALKAAEASGGGLARIRKRVSMFRRANEPMASGYELIHNEESFREHNSLDICIKPYKEERHGEDQELGSTPSTTMESDETVDIPDEEGIEVVAWGRLSGNNDFADEPEMSVPFEDQKGAIYMVQATSPKEEFAGTLSMLYRESDSTFIAFYRP